MEFSPNKLNDDSPIIFSKKSEKRLYSTFNDTKNTNLIFPIFDYSENNLPIILPKKGEKRLYSTLNDTKKTNLIFPIFDYLSNDSQNDLPIILPEKIKKPSILELAAKNILGKNENLLPNINK